VRLLLNADFPPVAIEVCIRTKKNWPSHGQ